MLSFSKILKVSCGRLTQPQTLSIIGLGRERGESKPTFQRFFFKTPLSLMVTLGRLPLFCMLLRDSKIVMETNSKSMG